MGGSRGVRIHRGAVSRREVRKFHYTIHWWMTAGKLTVFRGFAGKTIRGLVKLAEEQKQVIAFFSRIGYVICKTHWAGVRFGRFGIGLLAKPLLRMCLFYSSSRKSREWDLAV